MSVKQNKLIEPKQRRKTTASPAISADTTSQKKGVNFGEGIKAKVLVFDHSYHSYASIKNSINHEWIFLDLQVFLHPSWLFPRSRAPPHAKTNTKKKQKAKGTTTSNTQNNQKQQKFSVLCPTKIKYKVIHLSVAICDLVLIETAASPRFRVEQ
jgi:hypothetical protein